MADSGKMDWQDFFVGNLTLVMIWFVLDYIVKRTFKHKLVLGLQMCRVGLETCRRWLSSPSTYPETARYMRLHQRIYKRHKQDIMAVLARLDIDAEAVLARLDEIDVDTVLARLGIDVEADLASTGPLR